MRSRVKLRANDLPLRTADAPKRSPEDQAVWNQFAAAALTGLLARMNYDHAGFAEEAAKHADAMMARMKKG